MEFENKSPDLPGHLTEEPLSPEGRRTGPGWRAWVLTILVAIVLSVSATVLLGGAVAFRQDPTPAAAGGCGGGCCGEPGK